MSGVCHSVGTEPSFQSVTGEQFEHRTTNREDGARLDIVAQNLWGRNRQRAFFDVRVFNPYAPSYQSSTLAQCYWKNELEKKRAYEERVREIEHGSFLPSVFSAAGGMDTIATTVYKRLASLVAEKQGRPYSSTTALAKMQTELFIAEISHNVHSGLTIHLLPILYIPTHGIH